MRPGEGGAAGDGDERADGDLDGVQCQPREQRRFHSPLGRGSEPARDGPDREHAHDECGQPVPACDE